jgi:uncharacterized RDD family membrane protein YckC
MTSSEQSTQETTLGQYAGFTTRFIAWFMDRLLLTAIISISVAVISFLADSFRINEFLGLGEEMRLIVVVIAVGMAVSVPVVYNIGSWMLAGQTVGKWIMGLRVVQTNGQRLTFWASLRRQIGYVLSAILFLGFLWILFDNRRQGFHDKLAGTFVVYSWPEVEGPVRPIQDRMRRIRLERRMAEEEG